jgi:N,N'-diacetyllegionaminate synthase
VLIDTNDCVVVAEAGQCFAGELATAVRMAEDAATAGAWAFKTQLLTPELIAQPGAGKYWDDDAGTADQRAAFTQGGQLSEGELRELRAECDRVGVLFTASPFDTVSVALLDSLDPAFVKIASGDITNRRLLNAVNRLGRPVLLSCGAASRHEVERALDQLRDCRVLPLACTLAYPTADRDAQLRRIGQLEQITGRPVGYSDHTLGVDTALAAAAAGAVVLEKHYAADPGDTRVPDNQMGLTAVQLGEYADLAHHGARLRGGGAFAPLAAEQRARIGARRAVCASRDLPAGMTLVAGDLVELRPAVPGSDPWRVGEYYGRPLLVDVPAGHPVTLDQVG